MVSLWANQLAINSWRLLLKMTQRWILCSYPSGWAHTQPFPEWCLCNCVLPNNEAAAAADRHPKVSPAISLQLSTSAAGFSSDRKEVTFVGSCNRSIRSDGGSILRLLILALHPVSHRCWRIGVGISTCLGRKIEITEDGKSPESWDYLSRAPSVCSGRDMKRFVFSPSGSAALPPTAVDERVEVYSSINCC